MQVVRADARPWALRLAAVQGWSALLPPLLLSLAMAALTETVLLRLLVRVGVHFPKEGAVAAAFQAISWLGGFAFNLSSLLALLTGVVMLALLLQQPPAWRRPLLALAAAVLAAGLAFSAAGPSAEASLLFGLGAVALALVAASATLGGASARLATALMAAAYIFYQVYALGHQLWGLEGAASLPPFSSQALALGEGLVVAAAFLAFWAWGKPRWRHLGKEGLILVTGLTATVALAHLTPASTISILALWTSGLSLYLPWPLYLLGLWLYLASIVACWRDRAAWPLATGLFLLLLAGYMPQDSYHHLLLLLGLALLARPSLWPSPAGTAPLLSERP